MLETMLFLFVIGFVMIAVYCGRIALYTRRISEKLSELDDDVYRWMKRNPKLYH